MAMRDNIRGKGEIKIIAHKECTNSSWSDAIVQIVIDKNSNRIFSAFIAADTLTLSQ
jgi:hypothetical protein